MAIIEGVNLRVHLMFEAVSVFHHKFWQATNCACTASQKFAAVNRTPKSVRFAVILMTAGLLNTNVIAEETPAQSHTLSIAPFDYFSFESTLIDIRMEGIHWRVPRNYLRFAELNQIAVGHKSVKVIFFKMMTALPDFRGATPSTAICYKLTVSNFDVCPEAISISVNWNSPPSIGLNQAALAEASLIKNDDFYGLTKVTTKFGLSPSETYAFAGDRLETSVVISCMKDVPDVHNLRCRVHRWANGVPITYDFGKPQLPNWRRIDEGVVSLLASFDANS